MKKLKKIVSSALATLCLMTTLLTTASCGYYYMRWGDDVYIHNGEKYIHVEGFSANITDRLPIGCAFNSMMVLVEVYTDATDVDRNFICMDSKDNSNGLYIRESKAEDFSDRASLKISGINFIVDSNSKDLFYEILRYTIPAEFTFKEIVSQQPVSGLDFSRELIKINYWCELADYPLRCCPADIYLDGSSAYAVFEEAPEIYYEFMDQDFKSLFVEIYEKQTAEMTDEKE